MNVDMKRMKNIVIEEICVRFASAPVQKGRTYWFSLPNILNRRNARLLTSNAKRFLMSVWQLYNMKVNEQVNVKDYVIIYSVAIWANKASIHTSQSKCMSDSLLLYSSRHILHLNG